MTGEACEENGDDNGACFNVQNPPSILTGSVRNSLQPVGSIPGCTPFSAGCLDQEGQWCGQLPGTDQIVHFKNRACAFTCRSKFTLNKGCAGEGRGQYCPYIPLKRDYGLSDQVSSVI